MTTIKGQHPHVFARTRPSQSGANWRSCPGRPVSSICTDLKRERDNDAESHQKPLLHGRCVRYFRFDRYLINAKVPRARTKTARIDINPIPNILDPPVIPYMLTRTSNINSVSGTPGRARFCTHLLGAAASQVHAADRRPRSSFALAHQGLKLTKENINVDRLRQNPVRDLHCPRRVCV